MDSAFKLDAEDELRRLQLSARRSLQVVPSPRALTAPRLLRQFLESHLPELNFACNCKSHEMLLVKTQSFEVSGLSFVSAVCGRCNYHFHVKGDLQQARAYTDEHRHHMLIPCGQKSADDVLREQIGYNDVLGYARFICALDDCLFNIEISVMPYKISPAVVDKFNDASRMERNLELAQAQDPERYAVFNGQRSGVAGMLQTYLADALRHTGDRLLRINKRNKKFLVLIGSDFDDLLRSVGFYEGEDAETGESCWFISPPEDPQATTHIYSLRARMEDVLAELDILTGAPTKPAWDNLLHAFQGDFLNTPVDLAIASSITEDDLTTLGCLAGYAPQYFSWAAIVLAQLRPKDRDKYLDAGLRCTQERHYEAATEIIMYKSQFDGQPSIDPRVQAAFTFFDGRPEVGLTADWYLAKYYQMTKIDDTDDFKAEAQQHLEAIGSYLGRDIVSEIDPQMSIGLSVSDADAPGKRMSFGAAARLLGIEPNYPPEMIRGFVEKLVQDESVERSQIIQALDVLSDLKRHQDKPEEAAELQQIAEFIKATGDMPMLISEPLSSPQPTSLVDAPPGLKNIGNTCYLNSLLQYFYNVKVVRDLVLNCDTVQIDLNEETVSQRRTGGNGTSVNIEEAIVASLFVKMLQGLFYDLQTTNDTAACPSQKLANTALSSAREILDQSEPPPLPARPSPAPPVPPKANDDAANDAVNITVEPVNDKSETASTRSSRTLVDEGEDVPMSYVKEEKPDNNAVVQSTDDVKMQDSDESQVLDEMIDRVSRRLEQSDRSGTSQQDVGEIIGNILEHFMRAIPSDGPMPEKPELQSDKITQTFFTTMVNYTVKTKKGYPSNNVESYLEEAPLNVEIVPERWITAYPVEADKASDGTSSNQDTAKTESCTLYEALDRYFSYETIDDGNRARYSSIKALPPILHICIQRSTPKGKNKNPVIIPEVVYLDRYMEADKGSPLWSARKRAWALKERLKEFSEKPSHDVQDTPAQPAQPTESTAPDYSTLGLKTNDSTYEEFKSMEVEELTTMATESIGDSMAGVHLKQELFHDIDVKRKRKSSTSPGSTILKKVASPDSQVNQPVSDKFGDISWETSKPLNEMIGSELVQMQQQEQKTFEEMTNEKYSIHAVICHRGGTAAGHYWVWIRDFKRNVWYRYNDETVTEDSRGTDQVLKDLNETGDPYYVAYVRDEMKDELVDVPQRQKPETETETETETQGAASVVQDNDDVETAQYIKMAADERFYRA